MPAPEAHPDLPVRFQEILKGGPILPVDHEDLKRTWEFYRDVAKHAKGNFAIGFEVLQASWENLHLQAKGVRITTGTIVDASLIHVPSSTKNRERQVF